MDYRALTKTIHYRERGMSKDSENRGVNRRLLLLSAWTAPVVASFALGGMQSAPRTFTGNTTFGSGAIARSANNLGARSAPPPIARSANNFGPRSGPAPAAPGARPR